MKISFSVGAASLCLVLSSPVEAFTLTNLHSFAVAPLGSQPVAALVPGAGGLLYGTTSSGGTNGGGGTLFSIGTNGVFKSLYSFTGFGDGDSVMAGSAS